MTTVYLKSKGPVQGIQSLDELWERMARHDFTAPMSDDHSVYRRGVADAEEIKAALSRYDIPELYQLWNAWSKFGWGKGPKPEKPANWKEWILATAIGADPKTQEKAK